MAGCYAKVLSVGALCLTDFRFFRLFIEVEEDFFIFSLASFDHRSLALYYPCLAHWGLSSGVLSLLSVRLSRLSTFESVRPVALLPPSASGSQLTVNGVAQLVLVVGGLADESAR